LAGGHIIFFRLGVISRKIRHLLVEPYSLS
jgi:hypothetical protein